MPPASGYEVRAEFDHLVIRDDIVADLAGNSSHRLFEFQPQVTINTKGQLELHLTVPGSDVWTSLLTAMTVIRQSGYAPIAVHVLEKSRVDHPNPGTKQRLKLGEVPQPDRDAFQRLLRQAMRLGKFGYWMLELSADRG